MWRRYVLWFAHEHIDFRHAEMQSIFKVFDIPVRYIEDPTEFKPYWIVELPSEDCAKKIASRSVLLKNCIELWSKAKTDAQLHKNLRSSLENNTGKWLQGENIGENGSVNPHIGINGSATIDHHICPRDLIDACCSLKKKSFKIEVETFCKHFTMKEKVDKIEKFSYLPLDGPVKLNKPDIKLCYVEFYGVDPNNVPDEPHDLFFGKWVADGQRDLIHVHSLKKRNFIGNTSMDAQLSLLMANQALVTNGDFVLDPFVGSGSLLVSAAHFGAYVWGSDIDFMMLHGRTRPTRVGQKERAKEESIRSNMRQYKSESKYLDVMVSDFSLPMWKEQMTFDAIITDPPYGVREPTEKIGIERQGYTLTEQHLVHHIPAKVEYDMTHMYSDLLHFAARHLLLGKRLVCWYPVVREEYKEDQLPSHPCLRLISNSEQVLSKLAARRLLTYEKVYDDVDNVQAESRSGGQNFREKYFNSGEMTRKERKEKVAEQIAAYFASLNKVKPDVT